MNVRWILAALLALPLAACGDDDNDSDTADASADAGTGDGMSMEDGMGMGSDGITETQGASADGTFFVSYEIDGEPQVASTFSMTVSVFESDETTLVADATLALVESMPGMGHGMDTTPEIVAVGDGTFTVSNLAYSMAGTWQLDFTINSGDRTDTISFATECCGEMDGSGMDGMDM